MYTYITLPVSATTQENNDCKQTYVMFTVMQTLYHGEERDKTLHLLIHLSSSISCPSWARRSRIGAGERRDAPGEEARTSDVIRMQRMRLHGDELRAPRGKRWEHLAIPQDELEEPDKWDGNLGYFTLYSDITFRLPGTHGWRRAETLATRHRRDETASW